jgi:hypothetical protein
MKKLILSWTIADLQKHANQIEFGEYQREPSVWDLSKKQRLIDSILRGYDIASIYLYEKTANQYECVDGRQRINAIRSFLGINFTDSGNPLHNRFVFKSSDELLGKKSLPDYDGKQFKPLEDDEEGDFFSKSQQRQFLEYRINVIKLQDLKSEDDLHLMFLRLQLGSPLNAGERLNAMRGDMRDFIFQRFGRHEFFRDLKIPQRRFSKEQTAAQVALQYFSRLDTKNSSHPAGEFHTARFSDLQDFFRAKSVFNSADKKRTDNLDNELTIVSKALKESQHKVELKNRAMGVSLFFVLLELYGEGREDEVDLFLEFLKEFQTMVKEQVKLGIDIEPQYRGLLRFQTFITQAAVEKYAIEGRHKMLLEYFNEFLATGEIKEDLVD